MLVMVKVPPRMSSTESVPSRARWASASMSREICRMLLRSVSLITGTTRPLPVSTAIPML